MAQLLEIIERARALGLSGEAAEKLIVKEQEMLKERVDREERVAERELRKLELESAEADKQRVEAEKQRAHELLIANSGSNRAQEVSSNSAGLPYLEGFKLPLFTDGEDELDSFLQRFERLADIYKWRRDDYHVYLGSCLRGRALKVYTSLPDESITDYSKLKEALLKAYTVDADSYRRRFRESKIKDKESYIQLIVRMKHDLERWLSMSKVHKNYESLCDFLVIEQLLMNCGHDLRVFLKERGYSTSHDVAEAADRYRGAHNYREVKPRTSAKLVFSRENADLVKCRGCGKSGHIRPQCPDNPRNYKLKSNEAKVNFVFEAEIVPANSVSDPNGRLCEKPAKVVLDTGCSSVIVNENLVPSRFKLGQAAKVYDFLGVPSIFPRVRCLIQSKFFTGWVNAIAAPIKFADVLIGLIPGVKLPSDKPHPQHNIADKVTEDIVNTVKAEKKKLRSSDLKVDYANFSNGEVALNVQTRSLKISNAKTNALSCPDFFKLSINKDDFSREQQSCTTLRSIRDKIMNDDIIKNKGRSVSYQVIDKLVYRVCIASQNDYEVGAKQLVVPAKYRIDVMRLAHDALTAGHFSHRKTSSKIFDYFFWPGAGADIKRFCRSCPKCQKFSARGSVRKVPMKTIPVISVPFSRVAIDLVGPITPCSERGHKYILTLIDYATRYPEAVPLKNVDTITVAEALVEIFSRVGIPKEIMSDRGSQFKSDLMSEIHRLLSVKALYTSPYHACCNGAVERLNGVLKSIIKKLCSEHPKEWDRYIPAALFAYREIPNSSLKFSPFELLYGRKVRGPLSILHDLWTNDGIDNEVKTTYQYVLDLRSRLEETAKLAASHANISSKNYKAYYDLKSRPRKLEIGDEVLVLLPTSTNKLVMHWRGPYPIIRCHENGVDYIIKMQVKINCST
ncbi:uncharacterized protein LOC119596676 [Penaeus monodon]|uniref:uncharacterized protein LOC119596676 n=1 Tax=Penaeus monodon TaxID=6687 RepID=UPI0018A77E29|nr:uncharacterized protein LOC119596676 [Penaeus monodon]